MKLVLTHATVINQVANTSSTQHVLNIFTNVAEEYSQVLMMLQKATNAINEMIAKREQNSKDRLKDPKIPLFVEPRRLNVVLEVKEYDHRAPPNKIAVAEAAIKAIEAAHPAFIKPAADADKAAKLAIDAQNAANLELDQARQLKLETEKRELQLLKDKIKALEQGQEPHKDRDQVEIEAELKEQHDAQLEENRKREKILEAKAKKNAAKKSTAAKKE